MMMILKFMILTLALSFSNTKPMSKIPEIKITSPAFQQNGFIPEEYTCDGKNISPELSWKNVPAATKSLAIICDDPEAPRDNDNQLFCHWLIFNISKKISNLKKNIPATPIIELSIDGGKTKTATQGINSLGKRGYLGACPPKGDQAHRYIFKIYALDIKLENLDATTSKAQFLKEIGGHMIGYGELVGKYERKQNGNNLSKNFTTTKPILPDEKSSKKKPTEAKCEKFTDCGY